jgi:predicted metal-binding transcription factor (methanogenesis marker protein 9)
MWKWKNTIRTKPLLLLISFKGNFSAKDVYDCWIEKNVERAGCGTYSYVHIVQALSRKDLDEPQETCRDSWHRAENRNWDLWNTKQWWIKDQQMHRKPMH